jgi:hypothetical protein
MPVQKQGEWMPSGIGASRVTDEHLQLVEGFAKSVVSDEPGYSYEGKATYVTMVYDIRYLLMMHMYIHQHIVSSYVYRSFLIDIDVFFLKIEIHATASTRAHLFS